MNCFKSLFLAFLICIVAANAVATTPVIQSWSNEWDPGYGLDSDVTAYAYDSAGNEYIAASSEDMIGFGYMTVYKINPYGDIVWSLPEIWGGYIDTSAISVDSYGIVWLTGSLSIGRNSDAFLIMVSPTGTPLMIRDIKSPTGTPMSGSRIGFDPKGNVTVACQNATPQNDTDLFIVQYGRSGILMASSEQVEIDPGNVLDPPYLVFDKSGNLFVSGPARQMKGGMWEEFSPSAQLLQQEFTPDVVQGTKTTHTGYAVKVDPVGNIYVGSGRFVYISNMLSDDSFVIRAYNPQLVLQWMTNPVAGAEISDLQPLDLTHVAVLDQTGTTATSTIGAAMLFTGGAAPAWSHVTIGARSVTMDGRNGVVVQSAAGSTGDSGFFLQKYLANGAADWSVTTVSDLGSISTLHPWMAGNSIHLVGAISDRWQHIELLNYAEGISLSNLGFTSSTNTGGGTLNGTVTLNSPAPAGGYFVNLTSTEPAALGVPAQVYVPQGLSSAAFYAYASAVNSAQNPVVSAYGNGVRFQSTITLLPGVLQLVGLSANSVAGGATVTGTVTISAKAGAGGMVVQLASSNAAVATVPPFVVIPAGATVAHFSIVTHSVASTVLVNLAASCNAVVQHVQLTVHH